jgi:serine-type D-Ala-D-Ala carboxypeptidase/endopeptidase
MTRSLGSFLGAWLVVALLACAGPQPPPPIDAATPVDVVAPDAPDAPASLRETLERHAATFVGSGRLTINPAGTPEQVPQLPTLVLGVTTAEFTGIIILAREGVAQVPTARSVLPISSISKLFTGVLAARDVIDGTLSPSTPVRDLLASDLAPVVGDRTVLELVTHTAGYLPNPQNLDWTAHPNSPAADYSRAQLATCLAAPSCANGSAVRGRYLYSNLGVGLLGLALTDRHGASFEQLVTDRLTRGLAMDDTHTRPFADDARILGGVTLAGASVAPATMGALAPAGELLSTGDDMLRLVSAFVRPPADLAPAITLATTPAVDGHIGYAIDVVTRRGMMLWAKSGEQAGYSSQIMGCPALRSGAFALTNLGLSSKTLASLLIDVHAIIRDRGMY